MGASTYTFLFTDIEGSTRLWDEHPNVMGVALALHDQIVQSSITNNNGTVFKHTGDGLAASFDVAVDAANAAVDAQRLLSNTDWPATGPLRVRMGIHTGEAVQRDEDYFGPTLNRVARLMGVGHGGQILLSRVTGQLVDGDADWELLELGVHRLRDLSEAVHVLQIVGEGLEREFPELRTLDAYPSNLPRNLPTYVGREDLVDEIEDLLLKSPIVTLAGIGGVGKTRLAQQVGAQVLPHYDDGVWFVDLAQLRTGEAVLSSVAHTLAVRQRPTEDIMKTLSTTLRDRKTVIILDNSEQITAVVAELVEGIAGQAPDVRFIVTTRAPLGVYGEKVIRLEGLDPDASFALFGERAAEAGRRIDSTSDRQVIEELTEHLDGLPLAIELAAARTRSMSPTEILERVDQRFRILKGSDRRVDRHRTLEAMVDWSYGLLGEDEALLLDRLSVFVGSFDLASVEEVCSDDPLDRMDLIDLLDGLVDQSLVSVEPSDGITRYRLLETVQQYAARRLSEAEEEALRDRHVRYFSGRAQTLDARLQGHALASASVELGFDNDNLNAAIDHLTHRGRNDEKAQIVTALSVYWTIHGAVVGRQRFEELVDVADTLEPELRMAMLISAASLFAEQGYATRTLELLEQAKAVADAQDLEVPAFLYYVAAQVAETDGRPDDAIRLGETGIAIAEAEGDDFVLLALRSRILTSIAKTDTDLALEHARETIEIAKAQGADIFVAAGHFLEGTVHMLCGRLSEADDCFDLAIVSAGDALPQVVIGAKVESAMGRLDTEPDRARSLAREAVVIEAESDAMPSFRVIAGDLVASTWIKSGRIQDAAVVLAAGKGLRDRLGFGGVWWSQPIANQAWDQVRDALDPGAMDRAEALGRGMADDDVRTLIASDV